MTSISSRRRGRERPPEPHPVGRPPGADADFFFIEKNEAEEVLLRDVRHATP
jgi:hypothetical protein